MKIRNVKFKNHPILGCLELDFVNHYRIISGHAALSNYLQFYSTQFMKMRNLYKLGIRNEESLEMKNEE